MQVKRLGLREAVETAQSHTAYKNRVRGPTQHCLMLNLGLISLPHTDSMKPVPTAGLAKILKVPFPGERINRDSALDPLSGSLSSWAPSNQEGLETQFPT